VALKTLMEVGIEFHVACCRRAVAIALAEHAYLLKKKLIGYDVSIYCSYENKMPSPLHKCQQQTIVNSRQCTYA